MVETACAAAAEDCFGFRALISEKAFQEGCVYVNEIYHTV